MYFFTSNKNKFQEAKSILGADLKQHDIELEEIQSLDSEDIIKHKLSEAHKQFNEEFFVEDTSLIIHCMNGLPGPLIKWFIKSVGLEGIYKMALSLSNGEIIEATAKTIVGYRNKFGENKIFEGTVIGSIVPARGEKSFGWDPIFMPKGFSITFDEMSQDEKNEVSMRKIALLKLYNYLNN